MFYIYYFIQVDVFLIVVIVVIAILMLAAAIAIMLSFGNPDDMAGENLCKDIFPKAVVVIVHFIWSSRPVRWCQYGSHLLLYYFCHTMLQTPLDLVVDSICTSFGKLPMFGLAFLSLWWSPSPFFITNPKAPTKKSASSHVPHFPHNLF